MRRYTQSPGLVAPQTLFVSTLPQVVVEHIHSFGLDLLLDQRRYLSWKAVLPQSDFVRLRGFTVLLPTKILAHPLLPATHAYIETHENSIVFLLHDEARMLACHSGEDVGTEEGAPTNTYIVRCQKFPQQPFFYHHIVSRLLSATREGRQKVWMNQRFWFSTNFLIVVIPSRYSLNQGVCLWR